MKTLTPGKGKYITINRLVLYRRQITHRLRDSEHAIIGRLLDMNVLLVAAGSLSDLHRGSKVGEAKEVIRVGELYKELRRWDKFRACLGI